MNSFPSQILSAYPLIYALKFGDIIAEKSPVVHICRQGAFRGRGFRVKHSQFKDKGCTLCYRVDLNNRISGMGT